jgi:hypothetical protein
MVSLALLIGGLIFVMMGVVHGVLAVIDVFQPTQFTPVDDSVRMAMKSTTVRFLRARANVWDAWLGFNISHGIGMVVFGSAVVWLGLNLQHVASVDIALAGPVIVGFIYLLLSVRFWFYAPAVASSVATAFFVAGWWIH